MLEIVVEVAACPTEVRTASAAKFTAPEYVCVLIVLTSPVRVMPVASVVVKLMLYSGLLAPTDEEKVMGPDPALIVSAYGLFTVLEKLTPPDVVVSVKSAPKVTGP